MLRICRAGAAAGGSIVLWLRVKILVTHMALSPGSATYKVCELGQPPCPLKKLKFFIYKIGAECS